MNSKRSMNVELQPSEVQERGMRSQERLTTWIDWYRFARKTLAYAHGEAVSYANVRFAEEANRARYGGDRRVA